MSASVAVNRCLCVHSMSQIVDIAIQSLLYLRELIPEPMQQMIQFETDCKTVTQYQKICEGLRQIFKACNARVVQEIVIILGPTPYMPKEIYKIPVRLCEEHAGTVDVGCGDTCAALCSRDIRSVFMALQKFLNAETSTKGANMKFFIFARVSERLLNAKTAFDVEEDDSFEVPDDELIKRRKIISHEIRVQSCREEVLRCENATPAEAEKRGFWLRVVPYLVAQS